MGPKTGIIVNLLKYLSSIFGASKSPEAPSPAAPDQKLEAEEAVSKAVEITPLPKVQAPTPAHPQLPAYLDEEDQARRILSIAIARQATRFVTHSTTARVKLTSSQLKEGIKGKIVGKDGRNARHFEEKAGVDLLLNDEPDSVVISSFDAFRREVARVALENLVRDGRIQPARIEEVLAEAKSQVDQSARESGEKAARDLAIQKLHPALVRVLGTLKFRHSFGQNQLEHSIETAWIAGHLAAELGFNVEIARRAGLLHDLGKGLDQTHEAGHALAGAEFAKKYGESPEVVQAIAAHHEEVLPKAGIDHLVLAADALSGARPGARHGSTQNALDRATAMEKIAMETPGVDSAVAVQAGRELRIFVDSKKILDENMPGMARQIAERLQSEVKFPGQIKVTVLRELRVTEVAAR